MTLRLKICFLMYWAPLQLMLCRWSNNFHTSQDVFDMDIYLRVDLMKGRFCNGKYSSTKQCQAIFCDSVVLFICLSAHGKYRSDHLSKSCNNQNQRWYRSMTPGRFLEFNTWDIVGKLPNINIQDKTNTEVQLLGLKKVSLLQQKIFMRRVNRPSYGFRWPTVQLNTVIMRKLMIWLDDSLYSWLFLTL